MDFYPQRSDLNSEKRSSSFVNKGIMLEDTKEDKEIEIRGNKNYHSTDTGNSSNDLANNINLANGKENQKTTRQDIAVWLVGMSFVLALLVAMFTLGSMRGWHAPSPYDHNVTNSSKQRFLPEPFTEEPGVHGRYGTGRTGRWYYWKLPYDDISALTRLAVWLCYSCHQIFIWSILYWQQISKTQTVGETKYSSKMSKFNWASFGINVVFHIIHLVQTHLTYDGTAQDVSIASSQGSVIMLLVFVLLMEYRDRGLLFGWPAPGHTGKISRRLRLSSGPITLIRKYHGYAFSWAAIYTLWYHPMENTWGHAFGFFHTWIILLQGSLMYTRLHLNRYWRLLLEVWVLIHSGVVASQTAGPDLLGTSLWPMFVFGFAWLLCVTQLFGLPVWKTVPGWCRVLPVSVYLMIVLYCYSWIPDGEGRTWVRIQEIIRIPLIQYIAVLLAWVIIRLFLWIELKVCGKSPGGTKSLISQILCMCGFILTYVVMVTVSALIQIFDVQLDLTVIMVILVLFFILGVAISFMLLRKTFIGQGRQETSTSN
ncbi:uncharacterized protein LOC144344591 [Saccoglossus kowalevskii]